ncbi:efflux RND transporter periplasmic adaptor subunit [Allonocardiopsis opalescens]|uniref:Multidrug efflux pump subunit AcrA (Membrane-fusion protein) n=1 Tax=Allonocardiopsis opalescens TaxID=1144618 RepID=A0A2T0Q1V8_9ACTN|nr:peptidoglycan-binding protein [Allonocardiopsis opalescens]PRX97792.1 multidrug efflux pump subunit AcrA (membrane-fusion protein) [Allonocardiopsis opalescens]
MSRRRWIAGGAIGAVILVAAGAAGTALVGGAAADDTEAPSDDTATAQVRRGDLTGTATAAGTLEYADPFGVDAGVDGTVTALPGPGERVETGGELFRVDDEPVVLFPGSTPAWREFAWGMSDGPDVRQLERGLAELDLFDEEPDQEFTWATAAAVEEWQREEGLEVTGRIEPGRIVFAPGDLRIASAEVDPGDRVGPGTQVLTATGLGQVVTAEVDLADQESAEAGAEVTVNLPGNRRAAGTVTEVGVPTAVEDDLGETVRIPVTVELDDPEAAGALQQAGVTVELASETRENVLYVPVGALLALPGGGVGVELAPEGGDGGGGRVVPVETGLFTDGFVEVSGDGLAEGQRIVVPSR